MEKDSKKEKQVSDDKSLKAATPADRIITTKKELNEKKQQNQVEQEPLLGDSIFLRYLPVPFIKYLYEKGEESFLEIYRRYDYKHPILIWNADMRTTLDNKIKDNAH